MPANELHLTIWQRCNDMVISWNLNTLTCDISDSVLYPETTQILWNELNTRYDQANGARFYQLQKNLCQITQAAQLFVKREEDQRLIQFLVGFNPSYDTIRSNILIMQPLPSINRAYGILIQDETQKEIHTTTDFIASSESMNASSKGPTSGVTRENRRT
ncbi:uncharacterized protein LOC143614151 [Bidens hawaiensis]|uniref:uncharacterized protein LOC143614151 n=1 Tax=Bidens hawaiensis TaxID=980011 RepID=UPI004049449B